MRASVADKAGNVAEAVIDLPEGTSSPSEMVSSDPAEVSPPGISQISSGGQSGHHGRAGLHASESGRLRPTAGTRRPLGRASRQARPRPVTARSAGRNPPSGDSDRDTGSVGFGIAGTAEERKARLATSLRVPAAHLCRRSRCRRRHLRSAARPVQQCRPRRRRWHAPGSELAIQASSMLSMTRGPMVRRRSSCGSLRMADAPGFAAERTPTGSHRSTSTWAAKGRTGCAWWRGRRRVSATSRPRPATRRSRGSRSTVHRRSFSFCRRKLGPG